MANKKRKPFRLTVRGVRWEAEHRCEMLLSDAGAEYNHPVIEVKLRKAGDSDAPDHWNTVRVLIQFQRHEVRAAHHRGARYPMDTARRWSETYGGHVELHDADRAELRDAPYELDWRNELRVAVGRAVARAINVYNLRHVTSDECHQAVLGLERLGLFVEHIYLMAGEKMSRFEARDRGVTFNANERAETERKQVAADAEIAATEARAI